METKTATAMLAGKEHPMPNTLGDNSAGSASHEDVFLLTYRKENTAVKQQAREKLEHKNRVSSESSATGPSSEQQQSNFTLSKI